MRQLYLLALASWAAGLVARRRAPGAPAPRRWLSAAAKKGGFAKNAAPAKKAAASSFEKSRLREIAGVKSAAEKETAAWADWIASKLDATTAAFDPELTAKEDALLDECSETTRDLDKIDQLVADIADFAGDSVKVPAGTDWKLVWARSDEGVGEIGTGQHRVPLVRPIARTFPSSSSQGSAASRAGAARGDIPFLLGGQENANLGGHPGHRPLPEREERHLRLLVRQEGKALAAVRQGGRGDRQGEPLPSEHGAVFLPPSGRPPHP